MKENEKTYLFMKIVGTHLRVIEALAEWSGEDGGRAAIDKVAKAFEELEKYVEGM
jgi:hypothetical protein